MSQTSMHRRRLGRTGLMVSEVGFGAWGIGGGAWGEPDDKISLEALNAAVDHGINLIDTALAYGPHHSERLIGRVLRERGETVYVATKVPPKNLQWPARKGVSLQEIFPADHIRHCVERSLANLGVETIDLLQLHAWRDEWLGQGDWAETIDALRAEGKIRFFGISANDHEPDNAVLVVASGLVDTVQVIYNIFEQAPEDGLLPACAANDVGVIARVPFDEGALTGRIAPETKFPPGDFRASYFRGERLAEVHQRVEAIAADLGVGLDDLAESALRFVLSHPAVSTAIAGMRSVRNVERNCAAADGRGLAADQLELLRRHRWRKNFYA